MLIIWKRNIPGRQKSKCKGPVAEIGSAYLRNNKEAHVTRVVRVKEWSNEVREEAEVCHEGH